MRGRSGDINLNISQIRQVSVLLKLYNAVYIFYGEHAILPKVAFENVWKRSSDTEKGSAINFYQHTHLPSTVFFI